MKTLHIGNIANNAYLAARKERELGIDAHVISVDYTHIMGFPEWEEIEITKPVSDHFKDSFYENDFKRPNWFHSGSWQEIYDSFSFAGDKYEGTTKLNKNFNLKMRLNSLQFIFWKNLRAAWKAIIPLKLRARIVGDFLYPLRKHSAPLDLIYSIVSKFDFVTLYGPSTALANQISSVQVIALEHGTLRDFVDSKYLFAKDTKLGFEKAGVVLITNQDCLPKAYSMKLSNPIVTPHPINDFDFPNLRFHRRNNLQLGNILNSILVPARHTVPLDIDVGKGSEIIYEAIENIADRDHGIVFNLIEWGDALDYAKKRLAKLEKNGVVRWYPLMSRPLLRKAMVGSLAVIDQLKIPAYGAITADSLGLGVPVITRHLCENDINFFGSCAPVDNADSTQTLVDQLIRVSNLTSDELSLKLMNNSEWFDSNLSSQIAHQKRLQAYRVLEEKRTNE